MVSAVSYTVHTLTSPAALSAAMSNAMMNRAAAWRFLNGFAADWRAPLRPGDGCYAAELDAAEQRLELKLPAALRELSILEHSLCLDPQLIRNNICGLIKSRR